MIRPSCFPLNNLPSVKIVFIIQLINSRNVNRTPCMYIDYSNRTTTNVLYYMKYKKTIVPFGYQIFVKPVETVQRKIIHTYTHMGTRVCTHPDAGYILLHEELLRV